MEVDGGAQTLIVPTSPPHNLTSYSPPQHQGVHNILHPSHYLITSPLVNSRCLQHLTCSSQSLSNIITSASNVVTTSALKWLNHLTTSRPTQHLSISGVHNSSYPLLHLIPSLHTTSASSWVKHLTYAIPPQFFGIKVNHLFKLESHKLRPQRRGKTSSVLKPRQQSFILVLRVHLVDLLIPRKSIFLFKFPLKLLIPYTECQLLCWRMWYFPFKTSTFLPFCYALKGVIILLTGDKRCV